MSGPSHSTAYQSRPIQPIRFVDDNINRKLREPACKVLALYLGIARTTGNASVFPSRAYVAKRTGLSVSQISRANMRLAAAGLISQHVVVPKRVQVAHAAPWYNHVHVRVLETPTRTARGAFLVPASLNAWASRRGGWGGKRTKTQPVVVLDASGKNWCIPMKGRLVESHQKLFFFGSSRSQMSTSQSLQITLSSDLPKRACARGFYNNTGTRPMVERSFPRPGQNTRRVASLKPMIPAPHTGSRPVCKLGGTWAPRAGALPLTAMLEALRIPPEPRTGCHDLPRVIIPSPRKLRADATDEELVRALGSAYRSVLWQRRGLHSNYLLRGRLSEHKQFRKLLKTAKALREVGIPPVSWASFRFTAHSSPAVQDYLKTASKAPRPGFVWSLSSIEKHLDLYDEVGESYQLPNVIMLPEMRAFWERWDRMNRALRLLLEDTLPHEKEFKLQQAVSLIDAAFPGDSYDREASRIKAIGAKAQRAFTESTNQYKLPWWVRCR